VKRLSVAVRLADIAQLAGGMLSRGDRLAEINRLATLESADSASLSFLASRGYRSAAQATRAGAVMTSAALAELVASSAALIIVADPYRAYGVLAREFAARVSARREWAIHPSASIASSAILAPDIRIGPGVVIGERTRLDAQVEIGAGCVIGSDVVIGAGSRLQPRVTIEADCSIGERCLVHSGTVIGSDGFGFARHEQRWEKIPQLGAVRIGSDVEIGAKCSIDRGALDDTVIENGCKLDNLIQVAHNVHIGEHTAIAACVGIAGSARIGRRCMIGGAAGILGHLEICDDVVVSAMSLVSRSIDKPGFYSGIFPLMENSEWERAAVLVRQLPDLRARLRLIESRLKEP
jgi:UDP-3-O-[3-hydroxymyristoyl] glucosamine N-acyltransferase